MTNWLETDQSDKRPGHRYSPEDLGITGGAIREAFDAYYQRFLQTD